MKLVVSGMLNKQVGVKLGISEITVKAHRGKMMLKMQADSLADLVKIAVRLGLTPARNPMARFTRDLIEVFELMSDCSYYQPLGLNSKYS